MYLVPHWLWDESLKCLNRENGNKRRALWVLGVFARDWEKTMPAYAHARAAASGGRPAPVSGPGSGSGSGLGSGSLPAPVIFVPGHADMGHADHTRSASGSEPPSATAVCKIVATVGRLKRTVATVQTEPLQLLVGFRLKYPSRSAINSTPLLSIKTHQQEICLLNSV